MKQAKRADAGSKFLEHMELRELVFEASQALSRLDTTRLDELALCCHALNRDLAPPDSGRRSDLVRQTREAVANMTVFARVIEATEDNLAVLKRLQQLRVGRLEYCVGRSQHWAGKEGGNGNH